MRLIAYAALLCATVPAVAAANDIHLVCDGTGTVERGETVRASGFDWRSGRTVSVNGYTTRTAQVDSEVLVDIIGDGGRIKLPPTLTPAIRSRSDDGWRDFTTLSVGEAEINGRFALNFLNKPSVTINRMTDHINITALSRSFSGLCHPYDTATAARKF